MAVSMEMLIGRIGSLTGNLMFPILLEYGCIAPIINLACFTLRKYTFFILEYNFKHVINMTLRNRDVK